MFTTNKIIITDIMENLNKAQDNIRMLYEQLLSIKDLRIIVNDNKTDKLYGMGRKDFNSPYFTVVNITCPIYSIYDITHVHHVIDNNNEAYVYIEVK